MRIALAAVFFVACHTDETPKAAAPRAIAAATATAAATPTWRQLSTSDDLGSVQLAGRHVVATRIDRSKDAWELAVVPFGAPLRFGPSTNVAAKPATLSYAIGDGDDIGLYFMSDGVFLRSDDGGATFARDPFPVELNHPVAIGPRGFLLGVDACDVCQLLVRHQGAKEPQNLETGDLFPRWSAFASRGDVMYVAGVDVLKGVVYGEVDMRSGGARTTLIEENPHDMEHDPSAAALTFDATGDALVLSIAGRSIHGFRVHAGAVAETWRATSPAKLLAAKLAGAHGLALTEEPHVVLETADAGRHWSKVDAPPGVGAGPVNLACVAEGCVIGTWLRLGWTAP